MFRMCKGIGTVPKRIEAEGDEMRKRIIYSIAVGIALSTGCEPSSTDQIAQAREEPSVWEAKVREHVWKFNYIEVDGHQYLILDSTYRGGITHSPKCHCLSNKGKENN